ncbi:MAG: NAD(P)H-hydrate dehydratase [Nitrospirae bacterium]|nr:NAD(P)H-hydrate dehydratase [Nitrospirota bacterium]
MLKVAAAKEMQEIDRITIKKYGIAGVVLMERAGRVVAKKINEIFFQESGVRSQKSGVKQRITNNEQRITILVFCGGGNNGGDGFVIARLLHEQGKEVKVFLSAKPGDLKGDAKIKYNSALTSGVKIYPLKKFLSVHCSLFTVHCLIVDSLLGTGLSKPVAGDLAKCINLINSHRLSIAQKSGACLPAGKLRTSNFAVVSVDIPSGISSDTGQIMGCAVKADYTVTFGLPKRGHMIYPGAEHTGKLFIEDIGFPKELLASEKIKVNLIEKPDVIKILPQRPKYSHKGTYGHVLIIAGSKGKTGAAFMSAKACLRAGAGLVTIGVPESLSNIFQQRVTEEMVLPLPDKGNGTLSFRAVDAILKFANQKADVLAIGPGISVSDDISKLGGALIVNSKVPMVIDADGINAIAGRSSVLKKAKAPVILTPHVGEMIRLLEGSRGQGVKGSRFIEENRIDTAISFAKKTKTYLVLKGVPTVIATPEGAAVINPTGNPGMATAGTGDVLTGMISALLAQGLSPQNASISGAYMHGIAGDVVAGRKGEHSLIASDMIKAIPSVFKSFHSSNS